jgi:hypothetical protein
MPLPNTFLDQLYREFLTGIGPNPFGIANYATLFSKLRRRNVETPGWPKGVIADAMGAKSNISAPARRAEIRVIEDKLTQASGLIPMR